MTVHMSKIHNQSFNQHSNSEKKLPKWKSYRLFPSGLKRLYVTRIKKTFECDVFFPAISSTTWARVQDEQVPSEEQVCKTGSKARSCCQLFKNKYIILY
jgi:hypothetical protein